MSQTTSPKAAPSIDTPVIQPPSRFRALVRGNELGLVLVAVFVGAVSGGLVTAMSWAAQALHVLFFQLADGERLSGLSRLHSPWMVLIPVAGGPLDPQERELDHRLRDLLAVLDKVVHAEAE